MRLNISSIGLAIGLLLIVSCGNRRGDGEKLPKVKDDVLLAKLDSLGSQEFDFFYAKMSTRYQDSSRNVSFKTSLRVVQDSAMGATVSYASIPVMSAVISKDSVKMTNKQEKCFILQSIDFIKESFGVSFSHRNIEELFIGFPIAYSKEHKYKRVKDPYSYKVFSEIERDENSENNLKMFYELSKDLKELKSARLESPSDSTVIKIDYLTRQLVEGYMIPASVKMVITTPKQELNIELVYKKVRVNRRETIHFVIPESYEACK